MAIRQMDMYKKFPDGAGHEKIPRWTCIKNSQMEAAMRISQMDIHKKFPDGGVHANVTTYAKWDTFARDQLGVVLSRL